MKERTRIKILSPATQKVIIYTLFHKKSTSTASELAHELDDSQATTPSELANELHYFYDDDASIR